MADQINKTDVSELGEFGLIDKLTGAVSLRNKSSKIGIGDDAAVIDTGNEKYTLVSTDMLVEGVHFNMMYVPLKHLGYKAVVVNLSDIYSMNGTPKQITVSIAVSNRYTVEALEELYKGVNLACERYGVDLVGGDTTSSVSGLVISITAIGEVEKDKLVCRSGAKENDLICVSGDLGTAYLGLQLLEREKEVYKVNPNMKPDFSGYDYLLERQLKPEARNDVIEELKKQYIKPTAMIDISDGLSSELHHVCLSSNTGCKIFEEKLPIDSVSISLCEEFNLEPAVSALNGGEDYELLFTVPLEAHEKIKKNVSISVIGHMCEKSEGLSLIGKSGGVVSLKARGWNHQSDAD